MTATLVSVVVPAYREAEGIARVLDRLTEGVSLGFEILVVVDDRDDPTVAAVSDHAGQDQRIRTLVNTYGRGPANAIRFGIDHAQYPVVVVTMADGSDDPRMIDPLARLVERGVVVAAASRYSPGGQQVGGPALKARCPASQGEPWARSPGWGPTMPPTASRRTTPSSCATSGSTAATGSRSGSS